MASVTLSPVTWPIPEPGLDIRYSYLWEREAHEGRDEGDKAKPCAIIVVISREESSPVVRVLPTTQSPPADPMDALEIPPLTKRRLGLDEGQSWIILSKANDFIWPGSDLPPRIPGDLESVVNGMLTPGFFRILRDRLISRW